MIEHPKHATEQDAINAAGLALARGRAAEALMTPREQAEAAHVVGGPSVDELEKRIRARRAATSPTTASPTTKKASA